MVRLESYDLLQFPQMLEPGERIHFGVSAVISDERRSSLHKWDGRIVISGNGVTHEKEFSGWGEEISIQGFYVSMGIMPATYLNFTIEIQAQDLGGRWSWLTRKNAPFVLLARYGETVHVLERDEEENGGWPGGMLPSGEFPWIQAAIAAGAFVTGMVILRLKR